jgi:hypothetical protein
MGIEAAVAAVLKIDPLWARDELRKKARKRRLHAKLGRRPRNSAEKISPES